MNGPSHKIRAKTRKNRDIRLQWSWEAPRRTHWEGFPFASHMPYNFNGCSPPGPQGKPFIPYVSRDSIPEAKVGFPRLLLMSGITKRVYQISNHLSYWPAAWGGGWTVALFRGVRAGWIGRIPGFGWVCPALGLWRGAIEVSVVGMGSVSLEKEGGETQIHINVWESGKGVDRVLDGLAFPSTLIQTFQICLIDICQRVFHRMLCVTRCYEKRVGGKEVLTY